jgi:hypothetical protein
MADDGQDYSPKIRQLLGEFRDRHIGIDGRTAAALVYLNLRRGQDEDVDRLLEQRAESLDARDRSVIVDIFVRHILSSSTATTTAWEGYLQMRAHLWDNFDLARGESVIKSFLSRRRPDMASSVLSHLASDMDEPPTQHTFQMTLEGVTALCDEESLRLVHNLLKVSVSIEPNTALSNILMRAYAACNEQGQVLAIWNDIADSLEGPDYDSIVLALRACRFVSRGYGKALSIMERLKLASVPTDAAITGAYASVLVSCDRTDEAIRSVDKWKGIFEASIPVEMTAGAKSDEVKAQITAWVTDKHADVLDEFERGLAKA